MDAAPDLHVVMDHMPSLDPAPESRQLYESLIAELAQRSNFAIKLSQVIHKDEKGDIITAPHARLDQLMAAFGEDRMMFGRPTAWEPQPSRKPYRCCADFLLTAPVYRRRNISGATASAFIAGRNAMPASPTELLLVRDREVLRLSESPLGSRKISRSVQVQILGRGR
jgi:hypothetical protein